MQTDEHGYPTEPVLTHMSNYGPDACDGRAHDDFSGPRAVLIRWPSEELEPGDRVRRKDDHGAGTLSGYVRRGSVEVLWEHGGHAFWVPHQLEKIPPTEMKSIVHVVPLSVVERVLSNTVPFAGTKQEWVQEMIRRMVAAVDGMGVV